MRLHDLVAALHDFREMPAENPVVTSIEMDSRKVMDGSLFICIEGYTVDGHDFAKKAVDAGAVAVVAEKDVDVSVPVIKVRDTMRVMAILATAFYGMPTQKLHMIGITGTNGKTSVSHLIEEVLRKSGQKTGLIGTLGMKIAGVAFELKNTTPDSLTLQQNFAKMVEAEVETAVMEVSSHALHIGRVHGSEYDVTIFTNLTQDHLDYHKTMDAYRAAKSLLFSQMGSAIDPKKPKYAILNIDDAATAEYIVATQAIVLTYGVEQDADLRAVDIKTTPDGTTFTLMMNGARHEVKTKLVGKFNVYNILATIGASLASGLALADVLAIVPTLSGISGRFELVETDAPFTTIVDFAHTPDSLENVLATINDFATGDIYCIVGCGGDRDKLKRPVMAQIAERLSTYPIFTSDNPRTEEPEAILADLVAGVSGDRHKVIIDRMEAIEYAVAQAKEGDVILIAGKGHETYQIIGDKELPFDDRKMARRAVGKLKKIK